jgi:FSR family fosmidomycin resistance protein-like MFS transporter
LKIGKSKATFSPLLTIGHVVNDTYSNMLSGLLPVLTAVFSLSYVLAGVVAMVFNITSSILQPLMGRWFDRTQTTWLLEAGLVVNCAGMSLVGLSPSYVILLFLVGTAGLGSSAFHPPAFSSVFKSGDDSKGGTMSLFLSGGNVGFFLGPVVAGVLVSYYGLPGTMILLPVGLLTAALLLKFRTVKVTRENHETKVEGPSNFRLVALLAAITAFRTTTITSVSTFLPMYFVSRGDTLILATTIVSVWLGVGILGQLGGGFLSDRIGRRPVIAASLILSSISFYGFLVTDSWLSVVLLIASGILIYASWSVIVTMSSEAAPRHVGTVSGFMLGFSIGVGGIAALGFGAVADLFGLHYALVFFDAFALIGGAVALLLPARIPRTWRT